MEAAGAEKAKGDEGVADDVSEEATQSEYPEEPAEGSEEDVEAPGSERAGSDD